MKTSTFVLILLFLFAGCKKNADRETINVSVVVPANTTYNIQIRNINNDVVIQNGGSNTNFTLIGKSGDRIPIVYDFATSQQKYGQGTIAFTLNSSTLLVINGGYGTQTLNIP